MKKCPKREECESRHKRWLIIERLDNFRLYLDTGAPWLIITVVRGFPVSDLYCGYTVYTSPEDIKKISKPASEVCQHLILLTSIRNPMIKIKICIKRHYLNSHHDVRVLHLEKVLHPDRQLSGQTRSLYVPR